MIKKKSIYDNTGFKVFCWRLLMLSKLIKSFLDFEVAVPRQAHTASF